MFGVGKKAWDLYFSIIYIGNPSLYSVSPKLNPNWDVIHPNIDKVEVINKVKTEYLRSVFFFNIKNKFLKTK